MATRKKKSRTRSECCKRGWATRRRRARERSERAKRGWATRRKNARLAKLVEREELEERAELLPLKSKRAKAGWQKRKQLPPPRAVFIPKRPPVKRAPQRLSESKLEATIAGFAKRREDPDYWARDLASLYPEDIESVGQLYKAYFAIVSPP